ncbi:MAG: response regulator transcription factor [Elusimicrobiota bacterium]
MNNKNKTVLVVDDELHIRELIRDNLEAEGYNIIIATDGLEAIDLLEETKPDLVILDIMMPEMDGWEVCKNIKDRDKKIKIIMLTAKSGNRDRMIGEKILKADKYITKPFDIEKLIGEVHELIKTNE